MAPEPTRTFRTLCAVLTAAASLASPALAFRVVNYNLLNYPSSSSSGAINASVRNPHFRTILSPLGADIVVAQEMQSQAGVNLFLSDVLNTLEPGQWAAAPFTDGNDTDNALFYKPARVTFLGQRSFYVSVDGTRLVNEYRLRPAGYSGSASEFIVLSQHLKASTGSTNEAQRLREATGIRDTMNAYPAGTPAILMGDFNIYSGAEAAFLKFKESQANNNGRLYDPLNAPAITWNTGSLAGIHTQSPCNTCPGGWATGGLDDRFDMFLPTYAWNDGQGYELIPATYRSIGNDGLHYNLNITDAPVIPEGAAYASALLNASDHLPIRVDLRLPAQGSMTPALAFGTVIVGATAPALDLSVANAVAPLDVIDALDYTLAAPAGFAVATGPHAAAQGTTNLHPVTMLTATPGVLAGDLTMTSDDPSTPVRLAPLSGTVLRHAAASLDSLVSQSAATLDFGTAPEGSHPTLSFRVHDLGHDALQAQLRITAAAIAGGAGRFSLTPPFTPVTIGAVGRSFHVQFDAAGATEDSLYEASLELTTADEPLPGATPQATLSLLLGATLEGGGTVSVGGTLPSATVLFAPAPNPLRESSTLRFDVAREEAVAIAIYDLSGRRVAQLLDARLTPGRYSVTWSGRRSTGAAAGAGLYFVRLTTASGGRSTARLAIVR